MRWILAIFLFLLYSQPRVFAQQFNLVGSAAQLSCECYRLTDVQPGFQGGSVWNLNLVDLSNPFDFNFRVFLGCSNSPGADGICFVLQNTSVNVGGTGGGLGYMGFPNQSIGIELDTYQNSNYGDPFFDHIAMESNGAINHNLVAPVQASSTSQDVEDCAFHDFRVLWDPLNNNISVFFDGALRFSYVFTGGLINNIFNGNPNVFWGFTGATGAETNLQQFCLNISAGFTAGNNYSYCDPNNIPFFSNSQSGLNAIVGYLWDFGDGNTSNQQNPVHSYLAPGNYLVTLTITDQSGCTSTETHPIAIFNPPAATITTTDAGCGAASNGSAQLDIISGVSPFSVTSSSGSITSSSPTSFIASGLAPGNYSFIITDANGCSITLNFQINLSSGIQINQFFTDISCNGAADASISVSPSGGTAPYVFDLNGVTQASLVASSLGPGNYTILVTDASGCTASAQLGFSDPNPLSLNLISVSDVLCNGQNNGTMQCAASGGTAPFLFTLGSLVSSTGNFTALTPGFYTILLNDANGCTATQNFSIQEPPVLSLQTVQTLNPVCYGQNSGLIELSASGGVPGYLFQCGTFSGSSGQFSSLPAGPYIVSVTDNNACTASFSLTLVQPAQMLIQTILSIDPICHGDSNGQIQIQTSGGVVQNAYQYFWNTNPPQTSQNLSNLSAGAYSVVVTDDLGCTVQQSWVLTDPTFVLNPISDQQVCEGNRLKLVSGYIGGASPVSIEWTNISNAGVWYSDALDFLPTSSATFQVSATDANGCVAGLVFFDLLMLPSATPQFSLSGFSGCTPLCLNFSGNASLPDAQLNWLTGDGSVYSDTSAFLHCYSSPGIYSISIAAITQQGCSTVVNADSIIRVLSNPVADFDISSHEVFLDDPMLSILPAKEPSEGEEFRWISDLPIRHKDQVIYVSPADTGYYCVSLEVSNALACKDTLTKCFKAVLPYRLFIPSAFTPNADGLNDVFFPSGGPFARLEIRLFDRWGRMIFFETGTSLVGWNGDGFPHGVYTYLILAEDTKGNPYEYTGNVTLYR